MGNGQWTMVDGNPFACVRGEIPVTGPVRSPQGRLTRFAGPGREAGRMPAVPGGGSGRRGRRQGGIEGEVALTRVRAQPAVREALGHRLGRLFGSGAPPISSASMACSLASVEF